MKKLSLSVIFQNLTFTINSDFLQEGQRVAIHLPSPSHSSTSGFLHRLLSLTGLSSRCRLAVESWVQPTVSDLRPALLSKRNSHSTLGFLKKMIVFVCWTVCAPCGCLVPTEVRKGHPIPQNWS